MKQTAYEKKVNKVKNVIINYVLINEVDIYNTSYILCYLSGYMPDEPIGVCVDALMQLREEQEGIK